MGTEQRIGTEQRMGTDKRMGTERGMGTEKQIPKLQAGRPNSSPGMSARAGQGNRQQ